MNNLFQACTGPEGQKGEKGDVGPQGPQGVILGFAPTVQFKHGVASGDPIDNQSMVLWTKVTVNSNMTVVPVILYISKDLDGNINDKNLVLENNIVKKVQLYAKESNYFNLKYVVSDLDSNTKYYYQFKYWKLVENTNPHSRENDVWEVISSPVRQFKTLPESDSDLEQVKFGVLGCNSFVHSYRNQWYQLSKMKLDFIFQSGDYMYIDERFDNILAEREEDNDSPLMGAITATSTKEDIKKAINQLWDRARLDIDVQELHRKSVFLHQVGDHEIENNWNSRPGFLLRFYQKFSQFNPDFPIKDWIHLFFDVYELNMPVREVNGQSSMCKTQGYRFGKLLYIQKIDDYSLETDQLKEDNLNNGSLEGYPGLPSVTRDDNGEFNRDISSYKEAYLEYIKNISWSKISDQSLETISSNLDSNKDTIWKAYLTGAPGNTNYGHIVTNGIPENMTEDQLKAVMSYWPYASWANGFGDSKDYQFWKDIVNQLYNEGKVDHNFVHCYQIFADTSREKIHNIMKNYNNNMIFSGDYHTLTTRQIFSKEDLNKISANKDSFESNKFIDKNDNDKVLYPLATQMMAGVNAYIFTNYKSKSAEEDLYFDMESSFWKYNEPGVIQMSSRV